MGVNCDSGRSTFALHSVSGSAKVGAHSHAPVDASGSDSGRSESVPTSQPLTTAELRNEYLDIVRKLPGLDATGRRLAAQYMCNSEAVYHDEVVDFLYVPKLYSMLDITRFQDIVATTYAILEKLISHYVSDPAYRKHFGFSPELEELIVLDPGYDCAVPIMRMDIFYDEASGGFKFCEFNTDGTSAMNEDREVSTALSLTPSFQGFSARHQLEPFELFDSLVRCFLDIYHRSAHARKTKRMQPNIAIVDFLDLTTPYEIARFRDHFEAAGAQAEVCDIRHLRFDGQKLITPSGREIDAVYRRAVTADIMKHYHAVGDFLDAYRAGAFTLIGSFRTQIPHAKHSFEVLHLPETFAFLKPEEQDFIRAHVPRTLRLKSNLPELAQIICEKNAWIIKPLDSYGSQGVIAGRELAQSEWESIVRTVAANNDYIAQEYVKQYEADNLTCGFELTERGTPRDLGALPPIEPYRDLSGLFVYGGQFQGLLARAGKQDRICAATSGKTLGTFKIL